MRPRLRGSRRASDDRAPSAARYRGGIAHLAWNLQRVSGIALLAFLAVYVLQSVALGLGPSAFARLVGFYDNLVVRIVLLVPAVGALLVHACTGIRQIVLDLAPSAIRRQRDLAYLALIVAGVLFVPSALLILRPLWER